MKRIKMVFKLLILFAAIVIPLHSVVMVKADSGWDTSYGGGGGGSSWGGGGSSSYSYSYSYGNSWSSSSSYSGGSSTPMSKQTKIGITIFMCMFSSIVIIIQAIESFRIDSIRGFLWFVIHIACSVGVLLLNDFLFKNMESIYLPVMFIFFTVYTTIYSLIGFKSDEYVSSNIIIFLFAFWCLIGYIPFLIACLVPLIVCFIVHKIGFGERSYHKQSPFNYVDIPEYKIKRLLPSETLNSLKQKAYNIFYEVQMAWMNFDFDALDRLCGDELATTYKGQLTSLKVKNGQNIMKDFKINRQRLISIVEENGVIRIRYVLDVTFKDYVIDTRNNKVIRGKKHKKVNNYYLLTYNHDLNVDKGKYKCPKCGAVVVPNKEGRCEYCRTLLTNINNNMVLVKKEKI